MRVHRVTLPVVLVLAALAAAALPAHAAAGGCLPPLIPCAVAPEPRTEAEPEPGAGAAPAPAPPEIRPLGIGMTESDPRLYRATGPGAGAAQKLIDLRPDYIRVLVPWERLQPHKGLSPNWDAPPGGCPRLVPGCRSEDGLRGQLEAIRLRQQADGGGWQVVVMPYFTPPWAVRAPPSGCRRPKTPLRAQMPRIGAYRAFLRSLQGLGGKVGVQLRYWMAWNEPNHPAFINPQRSICKAGSQTLAPGLYAQLVRAAKAELHADQQLVLGSLAGLPAPRPYSSGAAEFARRLPRDVACLDAPFAQHSYVGKRKRRGTPANLAAAQALLRGVKAALDSHGCAKPKRLWITETGTFDHRCRTMADALAVWAKDSRIDAAFQYTFRESPDYPVGLVSATLGTTHGSYRAWKAFATATGSAPAKPCG